MAEEVFDVFDIFDVFDVFEVIDIFTLSTVFVTLPCPSLTTASVLCTKSSTTGMLFRRSTQIYMNEKMRDNETTEGEDRREKMFSEMYIATHA